MRSKIVFSNKFLTIFCKIFGLFYLIPFYFFIKDEGGSLYSYGYVFYTLFLSIITGIFISFGKVVSDYDKKNYNRTKIRCLSLAKKMSIIFGFFLFVILFFLAPIISKLIIKDVVVSSQISFIIKCVSFIMITTPISFTYKSYLKGINKNDVVVRVSTIERIIQLFFIIISCIVTIKLHLHIEKVVGISLFGILLGNLFSYFYLVSYIRKNKIHKTSSNTYERKITDKELFKSIFKFSFIFMMFDFFKTMYDIVDIFTLVRTISKFEVYTTSDISSIMSNLLLWGRGISIIIFGVSTGIIYKYVFDLKNDNELSNNVNDILKKVLVLVVPITISFSILSKPICYLFYGNTKYASSVLSYLVFSELLFSIYIVVIKILENFKEYKSIFISLVIGVIIKLLFNISLISNFNKMGLPPYIGSITTTLIAVFASLIFCLYILNRKYKVRYEVLLKNMFNVFMATILMVLVMVIIRLVIPIYSSIRILNLLLITIYGVISFVCYFIILSKTKCISIK